MMLKLVDTSRKFIILGIFILDKVTRLRTLLDPPPPQDRVSEFTGQYPLLLPIRFQPPPLSNASAHVLALPRRPVLKVLAVQSLE